MLNSSAQCLPPDSIRDGHHPNELATMLSGILQLEFGAARARECVDPSGDVNKNRLEDFISAGAPPAAKRQR